MDRLPLPEQFPEGGVAVSAADFFEADVERAIELASISPDADKDSDDTPKAKSVTSMFSDTELLKKTFGL